MVLKILLAAILLFILWFLISSKKDGNRRYKEAKLLEKQGKYKDACFTYAVAILNGSNYRKECEQGIKHL